MRTFIVALLLWSGSTCADEIIVEELICINEENGVIALTVQPCEDKNAREYYKMEHRAYATEANGTVHEGCWDRPDTADAPDVPGTRIIAVVNTYWPEVGQVVTYPASLFHPREQIRPADLI